MIIRIDVLKNAQMVPIFHMEMNLYVRMILNAQNLISIISNVTKMRNLDIIWIKMMAYIELVIKNAKNVLAQETKKIIIVQNVYLIFAF